MSVLPIYTYGAVVLRKKAQPITEVNDETLKLIMEMFETMRNANGIGLAANQVGVLQRVIVVDISGVEETKDVKPFPLINPEVITQSGTCVMEEGCLSIPEVRDDVERAEKITLRFKDTSFRDVQIEANGLLARVILHEIDHLNGTLFIDRLLSSRRKFHREKLKAIERGEMEVSYPVVTASVTV
ncbi:MAG: peptide deformylase [Ignavibacteriae bacterium]|nr:peptide deformylase [Ignavibacteriota bacterium]